MKSSNSALYDIYQEQHLTINGTCWSRMINSIIDHLGYTNIRTQFDYNLNYFPLLKDRLYDQFIQEWSVSINSMPKLDNYCTYKTIFCFEDYLVKIKN